MFGSSLSNTGSIFGTTTTTASIFSPNFFSNTTTTSTITVSGFGNTFSTPSNTFGTNAFGATGIALGTNTANAFSSGISGFGGTATTTAFPNFNLSGFGSTSIPTNLFNQQQQQNTTAVQQQILSVFQPAIYGDERDSLIGRFNQLMCAWGVGRGYHNKQGAFIDFKPDNPFAMFKAIGYSKFSNSKNEDGLVTFTFQKSESDIQSNQQSIIEKISQVFGTNRQNISINVHSLKKISNDKCDLTFNVEEKQGMSSLIVAATNLLNFFQRNRPQFPPQFPLIDIALHVTMTNEAVKSYLHTPPAGINSAIWEQAIHDNPDPSRFLPIIISGFSDLAARVEQQQHELQLQQKTILVMNEMMDGMKRRLDELNAKHDERVSIQTQLTHRILRVMVFLEIRRKSGLSLQVEEEAFASQLDSIQHQLNLPSQFKGRLKELMSHFRMHNIKNFNHALTGTYKIDDTAKLEVLKTLASQQEALNLLKTVLNEEWTDIKAIQKDMITNFVGQEKHFSYKF